MSNATELLKRASRALMLTRRYAAAFRSSDDREMIQAEVAIRAHLAAPEPASGAVQAVPEGWKLVPDWKVGMHCLFKGVEYQIFALGDRAGTFDLCLSDTIGDRWLNVPPSAMSPLAAPLPSVREGES
jgi:hypothetical protein